MEQRLLELTDIFAVGMYAYAVMSNHVHVVVRIDPVAAETWTDEEVAMRWIRSFPARTVGTAQSLNEKAAAMGQSWLKRIGSTQNLLRQQVA